jgi:hypothetical protein
MLIWCVRVLLALAIVACIIVPKLNFFKNMPGMLVVAGIGLVCVLAAAMAATFAQDKTIRTVGLVGGGLLALALLTVGGLYGAAVMALPN